MPAQSGAIYCQQLGLRLEVAICEVGSRAADLYDVQIHW